MIKKILTKPLQTNNLKNAMLLSQIQKANHRIKPFIRKTPLVRAYAFEEKYSLPHRLFFKCEQLQATHSFKARGAFNALLKLPTGQGVITRSSGNFAQAVSYAASCLQIPAHIIMPLSVPKIKKELTEKYHAHVLLYGEGHLEQQEKVVSLAKEMNLAVLSPYDHLDVIEGQATAGLEIYEELPSIRHYFCPVGGGGLAAGSMAALKQLDPSIHTIGVEPEEANDYFLSRQEGHRVKKETIHTIADGLRAPQVGNLNYPLLEQYLDTAMCITEVEIKQALCLLYKTMGLVVEPSGAVSIAGMIKALPHLPPGDTVCLLSGGNVDPDLFTAWVAEEL